MIQRVKTTLAVWFVMALERYLIEPITPDPNQPELGLIRGMLRAMFWFFVLAPPFLALLGWSFLRMHLRAEKTNKEEGA